MGDCGRAGTEGALLFTNLTESGSSLKIREVPIFKRGFTKRGVHEKGGSRKGGFTKRGVYEKGGSRKWGFTGYNT